MVGLVLLIACVNVANLTLARSTTRHTELAVRTALGAGRGRLTRQLLVENGVVAAAGGVLGLVVAVTGLGAIVAAAPPSIPRIDQVALDPAVLGFSAAVTVSTVLLFGLVPTVRSGKRASGAGLSQRGAGRSGDRSWGRLLSALVVSEVALALVLVVGAGLMVRTLEHLNDQELGFEREGAATFRLSVPSARYPTGPDTYAFYSQLRQRLLAQPGVNAVGVGSDLPVSGEGAVASVNTPDRVEAGVTEAVTVLQRRAGPGYFAALGTAVLEGREFDSQDRAEGPASVIISESLARELFPGRDAVGERVGFGRTPDEQDWMTVVGVVSDVRYEGMDGPVDPQVYQAHAQSAVREMAVVVRGDGDPAGLIAPARAAVRDLDPLVPVYSVDTLDGLVDTALAGRRFTMVLFSAFGLLALVLTMGGIYGVLAFVTGRRRREIGVRVALGAGARQVRALVLRRGMGLVTLGLAVGALVALGSGNLMRGLLFGVPPTDPWTFGTVALLMAMVSLAACWLPASRASRTEPMVVLREE